VVKTRDKFPLSGSSGNGWFSRRLQDQFGLLEGMLMPKVAQELQELNIPWQVAFIDTPKHP
jgi:hypothetical protein